MVEYARNPTSALPTLSDTHHYHAAFLSLVGALLHATIQVAIDTADPGRAL